MENFKNKSILIIGLYSSILSLLHGIFELLHGNLQIDGNLIYAISRDNQIGEKWHGNFPAFTIVQNYLITGILVCIMSYIQKLWTEV
jgi:hypothetical protein